MRRRKFIGKTSSRVEFGNWLCVVSRKLGVGDAIGEWKEQRALRGLRTGDDSWNTAEGLSQVA